MPDSGRGLLRVWKGVPPKAGEWQAPRLGVSQCEQGWWAPTPGSGQPPPPCLGPGACGRWPGLPRPQVCPVDLYMPPLTSLGRSGS